MNLFEIANKIRQQAKSIAASEKYNKHEILAITEPEFYNKIFHDENLVKKVIEVTPETEFCEITDVSCSYVTTTRCKCVKTMLFGRETVVTDILHAHTPFCGGCIESLGKDAKICIAHIDTEMTSVEEDEISKLQQTIKTLQQEKEDLQSKLSQQATELKEELDAEKVTANNAQAALALAEQERDALAKEKADLLEGFPEFPQQSTVDRYTEGSDRPGEIVVERYHDNPDGYGLA